MVVMGEGNHPIVLKDDFNPEKVPGIYWNNRLQQSNIIYYNKTSTKMTHSIKDQS